jgi:ABC-type transporter Mla subunit MlaD
MSSGLVLPGCRLSPYDGLMATLEDLEARVAALEATQADYRAVLAAVNALGANQREHAIGLGALKTELATVKTELADFRTETRATFRSVDEQLAEIKDLVIGRRNGS